MTAKRTAWAAFLIAAAVIVVVYLFKTAPPAADTHVSSEQSAQPRAVTSAEVDDANGFAQPSPDAPQAPEGATPMQYDRQTITSAPTPTPSPEDPEAVAKAFLTVYNTRASETDKTWRTGTQQWLTPELAQQLPDTPNGAVQGKAPTAVEKIEVKGNVAEWGRDTPLRWAHHVNVTVATQDQGTYLVEYRVRAQLTEQGWLLNAVPLDSWQRIEK